MEIEVASGIPVFPGPPPSECQPSTPGENITTMFMALRITMGWPMSNREGGDRGTFMGGIYTLLRCGF